jgi:hypothetical protein
MRNILLWALAGLVIGALGALGYSHYFGEGKQLAQLQAELNDANASLAKLMHDSQQAKSEANAMSDQIEQLTATKEDLTKKLDQSKTAAPTASPAFSPRNPMGDPARRKAMFARQTEQRMLLLKSRLHLTPDQEAAVRAALDDEQKRNEAMFSRMSQDGKMDPQAMADFRNAKPFDQVLNDILTPDQQAAYQQVQADQKASQAEVGAAVQMSQLGPLLGLTDAQKDQVYSVLCQNQMNMQDPNWIKNNANGSTNPMAALNQAKQDALAKILTPDQLSTYQQQVQLQQSQIQSFSGGSGSGPMIMPGSPSPGGVTSVFSSSSVPVSNSNSGLVSVSGGSSSSGGVVSVTSGSVSSSGSGSGSTSVTGSTSPVGTISVPTASPTPPPGTAP